MIFDCREPPWFERKIKNLINFKNQIQKDTPGWKSNHIFQFHYRYIQDLVNTKIDKSKRKYYENISCKVSNRSLNLKRYWFFLKALLNGRKIPSIPPIYRSNTFISDIKTKCEFINSHFAGQCIALVNNSQLLTRFTTHTGPVLTSTDLSVEQVC